MRAFTMVWTLLGAAGGGDDHLTTDAPDESSEVEGLDGDMDVEPDAADADVDTGVYVGGGRSSEMHLERWGLDGTPLWARTYGLELSPTALTDLAIEPGARWVHAVGYHTRGGHRDWYCDRRYIPDGFYYVYSPGDPIE